MTSARSILRHVASAVPPLLILLAITLVTVGCEADAKTPGIRQTSNISPSHDDASFTAGEHRPASAKTLFSMARILETQGKDSEAEYVLRTIVGQNPQFMPAYCELAETLLRQRRIDEAVHTLQTGQARAAMPDAVLLNDLGMCQLLRNDPAGALAYFTRASAIAPDDARYRSNLAVALGMTGRYDESLALYRLVLPDVDAHYNLAVLCEARHDEARAAQEFQLAQPSRATSTPPSEAPRSAEDPPHATQSSDTSSVPGPGIAGPFGPDESSPDLQQSAIPRLKNALPESLLPWLQTQRQHLVDQIADRLNEAVSSNLISDAEVAVHQMTVGWRQKSQEMASPSATDEREASISAEEHDRQGPRD